MGKKLESIFKNVGKVGMHAADHLLLEKAFVFPGWQGCSLLDNSL